MYVFYMCVSANNGVSKANFNNEWIWNLILTRNLGEIEAALVEEL